MIGLLRNIISSKLGFPRAISGIFWVTNRCNSKCVMCGIWKRKEKEDMNIERFNEIFSKSKILKNLNTITITGGEPFLRDDLDKFIEVITKHSKPIQIRFSTNGFLTENILKFMEHALKKYKSNKFSIKISMDGVGKEHDKMRGIPGAFDKVLQTIKELSKLKEKYKKRLGLGLSYTATSNNLEEIHKVKDLALQHGWEFFYKPYMKAKLLDNLENLDDELSIKPTQIDKVIQFNKSLFKTIKKQKILDRIINKQYYKLLTKYIKNPRKLIKCYAGTASFNIMPTGEVMPCLNLNMSMGNINEKDFDEIWFSKEAKKIRNFTKKSNCYCMNYCNTALSIIVDKFPFY